MKLARVLAVASLAMLAASPVLAQTPDARARAKEAYDRGVEAHAKGDLQRAAEEFARADALAPSPVALQAALDASIDADDPALGAELLERSAREKPSGALTASISAARSKFAGRAGRVRIECPGSTTCLATLDGKAVDTDKTVWARTGQHTVVVQVDGDAQTRLVRVEPNQTADVTATKGEDAAPAPAAETPPPVYDAPKTAKHDYSNGLPRIYFFAGVGVTVLLAGATTFFAIDTKNKHDEFESLGCARGAVGDCEDLKDQGERSQTNTNIGLVLTGVAAVGTAVLGAAFTDWKGPMIALSPGGAGAFVARKF